MFTEQLPNTFDYISSLPGLVCLVGDMNIHFDNPLQSLTKHTLTTLSLYSLVQIINKPTQKCGHTIKKSVNLKCYSSEELIALSILHEVVPSWYSFHSWVVWNNADKVSCSRTQHTIAGLRTVTSVSRNRHSNQTTNMLKLTGLLFDLMMTSIKLCC